MKKQYLTAGILLFLVCMLILPVRAEAARTGWVNRKGNRYYYKTNGEMVKSRFLKIGNGKYYFDKKGKMLRNTLITIRGNRYYFRKSGKTATGWVTLRGKKYYFDGDGIGQTGLKTIGNRKYFFDSDGVMQTGWQYFDGKKAYFYLKTGKMAVNRTIDGQKIGKKGILKQSRVDKARLQAEAKAKEILNSITNSGMSMSQKLRAAYDYMCNGGFRYVTWRPFSVYDGWEYDYALEIYNRRGGNCYNFACGFAVMAKVIGYKPYVIRGRIPGTRDGAGDGLTRHAFVSIGGLYYDPEAQFAGWAPGIYASPIYPMTCQVLGSRQI